MNHRHLDGKVSEWIARNVERTSMCSVDVLVELRDGRTFRVDDWGRIVELLSAPVSGEVCRKAVLSVGADAWRRYKERRIMDAWYENGVVVKED